jgi:ubiquitin-protein ligase
MTPPEIYFTVIPLHVHVYSNGHICLDILADGWSPALSILKVRVVCAHRLQIV